MAAAAEPGPTMVDSPSCEAAREEFLEALPDHYLEPGSHAHYHGRCLSTRFKGGGGGGGNPRVTWESQEKPRDDHEAPDWLTASEFQDSEQVSQVKVKTLAKLLRLSRRTVVYSGAGISVAAGIGQAARGAASGQITVEARPTFTHLALGLLAREGFIHSWEQQNHDGLPQKAGVPQELVNEIHGSWYDPSNPVVKYSGTLKNNNYEWMQRDATEADLVLVLGTSLGGLNADQIATNCAERVREWVQREREKDSNFTPRDLVSVGPTLQPLPPPHLPLEPEERFSWVCAHQPATDGAGRQGDTSYVR